MPVDDRLEELNIALQNTHDEETISVLQQRYYDLRGAFARLLFEAKNSPPDHYAWLLMDHDASCSLRRLVLAHDRRQQTGANELVERAYRRALVDFKWIVETAMLCRP